MSPHIWLLPVILITAGCDNDVENSIASPEREVPVATEFCADGDSHTNTGVFGPDNVWWHTDASELPPDLIGTGFDAGDTARDFVLIDQHGDAVQLYQFYGQVIVLELFVSWCASCKELTGIGQGLWEELEDDGFVYLSVMLEDTNGDAPGAPAAAEWASRFDLTHPVLVDTVGDQRDYVSIGYPTIVIIDRDMTILVPDFWPLDPIWIADFVR